MESMEKIYHHLTGVNIDEQKMIWDERGKGYYGEFLVLRNLYQNIPGVCKILMNLNIPTSSGDTTEVDLLMFHETGLYVFEVKHFKGTIYGKTSEHYWTQYFRTAQNHSFHNPVFQNQYHLNAIARRFPGIPIHSFIVFTNSSCELKIEGKMPDTTICVFDDLIRSFKSISSNKLSVLSLSEIDSLWRDFAPFSRVLNESVIVDGEVVPFYQYLDAMKSNFHEEIEKNKRHVIKAHSFVKITFVVFAILSFLLCYGYKNHCSLQIANAQRELAIFAQKFEHVEEFNDGEISISKDLIQVSDVVLEKSIDIENAINFSCSLTWNGDEYGVSVGENVKIVVILVDSSVKEYDFWNDTYPFTYVHHLSNSVFEQTASIAVHEFYDIDISDISYVKLINLGVFKLNKYPVEDIFTTFEIELFDAAAEKGIQ